MHDFGYTRRTFAFVAVVTALLLVLLNLSGTSLTSTMGLALFIGSLVTLTAGDLIAAPSFEADRTPHTIESFVVGFAFLSLTVLALSCCTTLSAGAAFCVCAMLVMVAWLTRRDAFDDVRFWPSESILALVAAAMLTWACRNQITSVPNLTATSMFHPWSDYLVHGATIAEFGDRLGVNQGDLLAAGRPLVFYHYGMFMMPAVMLGVPDLGSGLSLSTSVMLVVGLFLATMGCWALGNELGGPLAGILSTAALILLPDAATLGAHHGYFGFRWLMITVPGSGYGIGIASTGLVFLLRWQRSRRTIDLCLTAAMLLALAMFRAQVFAIEGPAVTLLVICTVWRHRLRWILVALASLVVLAVLATSLGPLGVFDQHYQLLAAWIDSVYQEPSAIAPIYRAAAASLGRPYALWVGLLGLPYLMLGPWLALHPICTWILWKREQLKFHDMFIPALTLVYGMMILLSGVPSNGDISEFKHRPFVWFYALLIIWPLSRTIGYFLPRGDDRTMTGTVVAASAVCLIVALANPRYDPQDTPLTWAKQHCNFELPNGLVPTAKYVRSHSSPGDRFMFMNGSEEAGIAMAALSDVPLYLAEGGVQWSREKELDAWARERVDLQTALRSAQGNASVDSLLRKARVHWLVLDISQPSSLDVSFRSDSVGLHELPR